MPSRYVYSNGMWVPISGITPYDEEDIEDAVLATSPDIYCTLTGSTPLANLGGSGQTVSATNGVGRGPAAEFDRPMLTPPDTDTVLTTSASNNSTGVSIACWVFLDYEGTLADVQSIAAKGTSPAGFQNRNYFFAVDHTSLAPRFSRFSGTNGSIDLAPNHILPLGEWHHLGVTYESGSLIFYLDGVPDTTITTTTGNLNTGSRATYIGSIQGRSHHTWRGMLAHWAVWNSVISPAQMASIAAAGVPA